MMSEGHRLYNKAKELIPGGTQLFSKRPELYAPEQWPPYYRKASGCYIWDLDGRKFIDMQTMGIGSCLLGYANPDVNRAVVEAVNRGNMSSLNPPSEVELAELLVEIHPWADMVRFARTGGESMAVAIRIARASSGREGIAFCGYHGWHDWYLAANLSDNSNLDGHLLRGLSPKGVPKSLTNTVFPFRYNRIEELELILRKYNDYVGTVVMEPLRYNEPESGFLDKVRELTRDKGIVLIFDEITSGWRHSIGGVHKLYNVEPDIAVFAKALGNGFPIGAIIGKKEVMDVAQESFISSTYWTESIGPTAAITTITKLKELDVPEVLGQVGEKVQTIWRDAAREYEINIAVEGKPALTHFVFKYENIDVQEISTLFTQEMLKEGFLAGTGFYASYAHTEKVISEYEIAIRRVFKKIARAIVDDSVTSMLKGPKAIKSFTRLT